MSLIAIVIDERNIVSSLRMSLEAEGHAVDGYLDPLVALPKLICVPPKEPRWQDVNDLEDLTPQLVEEIQHFFEVYKALEPGKTSSTGGLAGREAAGPEIREAQANYARPHDGAPKGH